MCQRTLTSRMFQLNKKRPQNIFQTHHFKSFLVLWKHVQTAHAYICFRFLPQFAPTKFLPTSLLIHVTQTNSGISQNVQCKLQVQTFPEKYSIAVNDKGDVRRKGCSNGRTSVSETWESRLDLSCFGTQKLWTPDTEICLSG